MAITLILGGIRSGKSFFAESLLPAEGPARYLATGNSVVGDTAWMERIAVHRSRRPSQWTTAETAYIAAELRASAPAPTLVDDLGGWLTATMDARGAWDGGADAVTPDIGELLDAIDAYTADLVIVSPEVGLTVVPATSSGQLFVDTLGTLNQAVAALCESVVLVVAGQPLVIKGSFA